VAVHRIIGGSFSICQELPNAELAGKDPAKYLCSNVNVVRMEGEAGPVSANTNSPPAHAL
jgi:hypothetical protein